LTTRPHRWLGFTPREHVAGLAIFAAVTLLFFFPVLQGDTFSEVGLRQQNAYPWAASTPSGEPSQILHLDQVDAFYSWQVFVNRELRRGEFPFWDPHTFAGHPFFANGTNAVLYPPKATLASTVSPARVHDLLTLSHLFLAGVAMFLFLGVVRLSFGPALVGSLAWMLNSFALSWQALDHYTAVAVWLPAAMLLAHVTVRRRSQAAALGLAGALGLMLLGGNVLFVELAALTIFAYGGTLVVADVIRDRTSLPGHVLRLASAAVLFVGLTAVVILPTLALAADNPRVEFGYDELERFALPLSGLVNIVYPRNIAPGEPYNFNLFAGTLVSLLALVGVFRRNALALFAGALGALAVLYMLHTPVTLVLSQTVPGLDSFKPLARAAFLLDFALAVLAAFGLQRVLDWLRGRRLPLSGSWVAAAVVAVVAASVVVQEYRLARFLMPHQPNEPAYLFPRTPLVDYLDARKGRFIPTSRSFRGSTPVVFPLDTAAGYDSLLPRRVQDFWRVLGDGLDPGTLDTNPLIFAYYPEYDVRRLRPELLARAGVAYVVVPPDVPARLIPAGLRPGYSGPDGRVLVVPGSLPRAYLAGGCEEVVDARAALERFVSAEVDTAGTALLERRYPRPDSHRCDGRSQRGVGTAVVVEQSVNSLRVRVRAERDGWLVVTDSWDGGWRVSVDGEAADVVPANYAQRAVAVSEGEHTVRFTYRPVHFRYGVAISAVSLAIVLGGLVLVAARRARVA
jgi:hypothetical protein